MDILRNAVRGNACRKLITVQFQTLGRLSQDVFLRIALRVEGSLAFEEPIGVIPKPVLLSRALGSYSRVHSPRVNRGQRIMPECPLDLPLLGQRLQRGMDLSAERTLEVRILNDG